MQHSCRTHACAHQHSLLPEKKTAVELKPRASLCRISAAETDIVSEDFSLGYKYIEIPPGGRGAAVWF